MVITPLNSNSQKETLNHGLRMQSTVVGQSSSRGVKTAGHSSSAVRKQQQVNVATWLLFANASA